MKVILFVIAAVVVIGGLYWASSPPDVLDSPETVAMLSRRDKESEQSTRRSSSVDLAPRQKSVPGTINNPSLELEKQKAIWDLEHSTFELEWKFGKLIKEAIKANRPEGLVACFKDDFTATIPLASSDRVIQGTSWIQQSVQVTGADQVRTATAAELSDFLLDEFSVLDEIKSIGLRVLKIDRSDDHPEVYRLKILIYAKGTSQTRPASISSLHRLTVQFANDEEIIAGNIVRRWHVDQMTSRESPKPLFGEVSESFGLSEVDLPDNWKLPPLSQPDTYTSQIAVEDFDRDGYLDIAVATLQGQQYLLRNVDGLKYEDVTQDVGLSKSRLPSKTTLATWIDYDNDDFPDLLLGKNLYHNEQGREFRRVTSTVGLRFNSATMGAVVADYDCDGWLDLYVLNHLGHRDPNQAFSFVGDDNTSGKPNQLWRNLGNGTFQDVTSQAGVDGGARHSFSAAWMHANDDHYPDLYVVNDFGRNLFFINRGDGSFDEAALDAKVGDYANSMGVACGDLDNDGHSEIYVANMFSKMGRRIIAHVSDDDFNSEIFQGIRGACAGSHLYRINSDSSQSAAVYEEISEPKNVNAIGWAYAPVFADFDADGLLDIYATSGFISVDRRKPDG